MARFFINFDYKMSTRSLYKSVLNCIKHPMCDLICDVITALFEAAIWVKSTHLIISCYKSRKKGQHMEIKEIFT